MTAVAETNHAEPQAPATVVSPPVAGRSAISAAGLGIAALAAGGAVAGLAAQPSLVGRSLALVALVWAGSAAVVGLRRRDEALGFGMAAIALAGAVGVAATILDRADAAGDPTVRGIERGAAALGAALLLHLALALPAGRLGPPWRRAAAAAGYAAAIAWAVASDGPPRFDTPAVVVVVTAGAVAVGAYTARCRTAGPVDRARLQWAGWGAVVTALVALSAVVLHQLLDWPTAPGALTAVATALVPISLGLASVEHLAVRIDRLLTHTIVVAGLVSLVAAVYLVIVLGLGELPDDAARRLLALSMVSAMLAAALALPARRRLTEFAHRRVYGEQRSPEEALDTFGSRMSRAVPMDELLLQLAETLKASLRLSAAEVWTGSDGVLDRVISVPDRGETRLVLHDEELTVVSRARVSGNAWIAVWMPDLLAGRGERMVRVAPVAHSGELLGLLVIERPADAIPFADEEERVLTELARQVGLALHNVRLDSALQASLDELEIRNDELAASRLRIVTAADESRRTIERNLHDGAQQHLVALAVKVGLIKQLMEADPETAGGLLDELRGDVQSTLTELRELAHGIYPPLLRERGLGEALRTAANRSPLPVTVDAGVERYASEIEAAIYFCCLEAMQNAAKHAGESASLAVNIASGPDTLTVTVSDDGAGFDPASVVTSHGFVNMADRVGAVGGRFDVRSAPGEGTTIEVRVPAAPLA